MVKASIICHEWKCSGASSSITHIKLCVKLINSFINFKDAEDSLWETGLPSVQAFMWLQDFQDGSEGQKDQPSFGLYQGCPVLGLVFKSQTNRRWGRYTKKHDLIITESLNMTVLWVHPDIAKTWILHHENTLSHNHWLWGVFDAEKHPYPITPTLQFWISTLRLFVPRNQNSSEWTPFLYC